MARAAHSAGTAVAAATSGSAGRILGVLHRRIWLPRRLYAAVPWFYLGSGSGALFGGLFLPDDTWFLPYLLLLGLACLHAAVALTSLRQRRRPAAPPAAPAATLPAGKLPE